MKVKCPNGICGWEDDVEVDYVADDGVCAIIMDGMLQAVLCPCCGLAMRKMEAE